MQSAKAAVSSFLNKSGHHDTTVHEDVNSAVTHETVKPTRHENVITAVDKEVHQDHHHTTVMPVTDREVLPEKHTHNVAGVQHREVRHGNDSDIKERLQTEAAQFKNERSIVDTKHTQSQVPVQQGEHVHHHVHEHIQPVVHKETVQPEVVHTTVPIHEVHHNAAKHHAASVLPAMSMDEFKRNGGALTGRGEKVDSFDGCPRLAVGDNQHGSHQHGTTGTTAAMGTGAAAGLAAADKTHNRSDSGIKGIGHRRGSNSSLSSSDEEGLKKHRHSNKLKTGTATGAMGTTAGHSEGRHSSVGGLGGGATHAAGSDLGHSHSRNSTTSTKSKPSLMDKLNPKIDANGDGKAGFMS